MRRLMRSIMGLLVALSLVALVPVRSHAQQDNQCPNGCDNGGGPQFDPSMANVQNADGEGNFCEPFRTNAGYYCTCEEVEFFFGAFTDDYFDAYGWNYWYYYIPYYLDGDVTAGVCVY